MAQEAALENRVPIRLPAGERISRRNHIRSEVFACETEDEQEHRRRERSEEGVNAPPPQHHPDEAQNGEQHVEHDLDIEGPRRPDAREDLVRVVMLYEDHALREHQRIEERPGRPVRMEDTLEHE